MVVHIVLFRPRPDLSDADRQEMFDALRSAATNIPSIRRFHVGTRQTHGAAYERLATQDFPFAAIVEFDDVAGLQAYLRHPEHEKLGALFYRLQELAVAYDYEVEAIN